MTEDWIESKKQARLRRASTRERGRFFSGRRQLELWGLIAVLAILVWLAVWEGWETISIAALIAAWIVYSLHHSFTAVLHQMHRVLGELYELNDREFLAEQERENF